MKTARISDVNVQDEAPRVIRDESPWVIEFFVFFVVSLQCVSAGFVAAWTPPEFKHDDEDDQPFFVPQTDHFGFIIVAPYVIGFAASLVFGCLANWYGRKAALYVAAIFGSVSGFTFLFAESPAPVYAGRVASCICMAGATVICPVYVIETVRHSSRGVFVPMCVIFIFFGVLLGGGMRQLMRYTPYCTFLTVLPSLFVFLFFWLPESPYYYMSKSKLQHAESSLMWMRGRNYTQQDLESTVKLFEQKKFGIRRALILYLIRGIGGMYITMHCLQKPTVSQTIYSTTNNTAVIMALIILLSSFLGTLATNLVGRKMLLYLSYGGCAVCSVIIAAYKFIEIEKYEFIPILFIGISTVFNGIGYGTLTPLVAMEMTDARRRCFISCMGSSLEYLASFSLVVAYPFIEIYLCSSVNYLVAAIANSFGIYFTWLAVTEMKGESPKNEEPSSVFPRIDPVP